MDHPTQVCSSLHHRVLRALAVNSRSRELPQVGLHLQSWAYAAFHRELQAIYGGVPQEVSIPKKHG
jgi:hypothetical protein